jgi:crotonobetainyl-CoA:carnitine CoA-transferase CaiB-like acyl-CoA transferase
MRALDGITVVAVPALGEHTETILAELDLPAALIERLRADRAL